MSITIPHSALTLLILEINRLIDTGDYDGITLDDVAARVDDGTILQFLDANSLPTGRFLAHRNGGTYGDFEDWYVAYLQAMYKTYGGEADSKFGVRKRGLCALLAWTNEIVQQGAGWQPNPRVVRRT
jgi:hypothetical protein